MLCAQLEVPQFQPFRNPEIVQLPIHAKKVEAYRKLIRTFISILLEAKMKRDGVANASSHLVAREVAESANRSSYEILAIEREMSTVRSHTLCSAAYTNATESRTIVAR